MPELDPTLGSLAPQTDPWLEQWQRAMAMRGPQQWQATPTPPQIPMEAPAPQQSGLAGIAQRWVVDPAKSAFDQVRNSPWLYPSDNTPPSPFPEAPLPHPTAIAAQRTQQSVVPAGGRREGAATDRPDAGLVIPRSPADLAFQAQMLPLPLPAKAAIAGLGLALEPTEAWASKFDAIKAGLRGVKSAIPAEMRGGASALPKTGGSFSPELPYQPPTPRALPPKVELPPPASLQDAVKQAGEEYKAATAAKQPPAQPAEPYAPIPIPEKAPAKTGRAEAITALNFRELPIDEANRIASAGQHIITKPDGAIVGAPVAIRTPEDIAAMRSNFDATLRTGESADYNWYQDMRDMVSTATRGMPPPTPRPGAGLPGVGHNGGPPLEGAGDLLASELAHTSPQRQPDPNLGAAIRMGTAYNIGKPLEKFPTGRAAKSYIEARDQGRPVREILGKKTGVYQKGLSPEQPWGTTGTNDIWHARALGYVDPATGKPWSSALTPQQHAFMDGETILATQRANAAKLGGRDDWKPLEIQAMAWVGKRAESYMAEGIPRAEAMLLAKRSYREAEAKYTGLATSEVTPSIVARHRTDIAEGSPQARQEYFDKMRWAPGETPDPLYVGAKIPQRLSEEMTGIYQMPGGPQEVNPGEVIRPYVGRVGKSGERVMAPESNEAMNQIEALRAFLGVQGGYGYSQLTPTNKAGRMGDVLFNPGGQLTPEQIKKLSGISGGTGANLPDVAHFGPNEALLTNWGADRPGLDKATTKRLASQLEAQGYTGVAPVERAGGFGEFWKEWSKPQGSGAATKKLFSIFQNETMMDSLASESGAAARQKVQAFIDDNTAAAARGAPVRDDIMNVYKTLINNNLPGIDLRGLREAVKKGAIALPALYGLGAIFSNETMPLSSQFEQRG